jgi:hypothetical protein
LPKAQAQEIQILVAVAVAIVKTNSEISLVETKAQNVMVLAETINVLLEVKDQEDLSKPISNYEKRLNINLNA